MKRFCLLAALLLTALAPSLAREVKKTVIAVETENSALVLLVQENGQVFNLHYGTRVGDAQQFLGIALGTEDYNSVAGLAYPATGGALSASPPFMSSMPTAPTIRSSAISAIPSRSGKAAPPRPSTWKTPLPALR